MHPQIQFGDKEKIDKVKSHSENIGNKIRQGESMEANTTISIQWERLYKYYQQKDLLNKVCQSTIKEKIAEFESSFEINFPQDFRESFLICDERYILKTNEKKGWLGENELYSFSSNKYDWYNIFEVNKQIFSFANDIGWNKKWIQFYDYETWYSAVLDTETGKVYCYENETGINVLWANSFTEWFKMAVDEVIQYGELRIETMENLLGLEE